MNNEIYITSFSKEDLDKIHVIEELCFPIPWSKDSLEKELSNKFAKYVVAKMNNTIIGYGGMWLILDEAHITNIAVHPEFRGIGSGSKILQGLIDICKYKDIKSMTLEVRVSNIIAQKLYKKFNLQEEGIRKGYYNDNKEDAIIMWKRDL